MRGEHIILMEYYRRKEGSSPHARGTRSEWFGRAVIAGIIPACAGNTGLVFSMLFGAWDHPRMRGEHALLMTYCTSSPGSSPHARGTRALHAVTHFHPGIIPACAGNTSSACSLPTRVRDHPRMRGEHLNRVLLPPLPRGSSPHARGTLIFYCWWWWGVGIIPACAGNTRPSSGSTTIRWDHPRMRGEHSGRRYSTIAGLGSSPHARGTLDVEGRSQGFHGIIPACAGNTFTRYRDCRKDWDHPRMRGEHLLRR